MFIFDKNALNVNYTEKTIKYREKTILSTLSSLHSLLKKITIINDIINTKNKFSGYSCGKHLF